MALERRPPDYDAVERVATGTTGTADAGGLAALRRLSVVPVPAPAVIAERAEALAGAADALEAVAGTEAGRAQELAGLLERAVRFHDTHASDDFTTT